MENVITVAKNYGFYFKHKDDNIYEESEYLFELHALVSDFGLDHETAIYDYKESWEDDANEDIISFIKRIGTDLGHLANSYKMISFWENCNTEDGSLFVGWQYPIEEINPVKEEDLQELVKVMEKYGLFKIGVEQ